MMAHPVLLQKKYARVIELLANTLHIETSQALDIFYHSMVYQLMREGVSDMNCRSEGYLLDELIGEIGTAG